MAINLGSTAIADVKLGTTQVEKIYLGTEQVWGGSPAPTADYGEVVLYGYDTSTTPITIDKTTTTTRVIQSASEFSKLRPVTIDDVSCILDDATPTAAIKECKVGSTPTSLPDDFLKEAENFTTLDLTDATSLTSLGTRVLNGCTSFNAPLVIPDTVTSIGVDFMKNCSAFNSTITLSSGVATIPIRFMNGCTSFNKPLAIPEGVTAISSDSFTNMSSFNSAFSLPSTLQTIALRSFNGWTAFNQNVTLPQSLTSVGTYFFKGLRNMTGTLNIGSLPATIFATNNYTLSASNNTGAAYTTGITIKGATRAEFLSRFPNRSSSPYRRLLNGGA